MAWQLCSDLPGCQPPPPCPGTGNCCAFGGNGTPGCNDASCCNAVCEQLPHCCEVEWDHDCSQLAASICGSASNCHPNNCQFFCGGQSPGGCWCDERCFDFKDCCNGVCNACPSLPPCSDPTNNSCIGFCGGQPPGGCWCDQACQEPAAFCCADVCAACSIPWCPTTHPADFNADGAINVFDLLILLSNWGQCQPPGPCVGDLTGDRFVNVFDLLVLLSHWGTPPPPEESCSGNCGYATAACWCDESCCTFHDCCADKFLKCGGCQP